MRNLEIFGAGATQGKTFKPAFNLNVCSTALTQSNCSNKAQAMQPEDGVIDEIACLASLGLCMINDGYNYSRVGSWCPRSTDAVGGGWNDIISI